MLVLSRKENEEIWIDDGRIKLFVTHIGRQIVKIGIEAPITINIKRKELVPLKLRTLTNKVVRRMHNAKK